MINIFALLTAVFAAALVGTGRLTVILRRRQVVDVPGERSSHTVATPRGGGLAIVAAVLAGFVLSTLGASGAASVDPDLRILITGGVALAGLSWIDDLKSLPAGLRLSIQAAVVAASVWFLGFDAPVLPFDSPVWLDKIVIGVFWLAFLNFFNFMDGIDGISFVETVVIGCGIVLIHAIFRGLATDDLTLAVLVAATAGFAWWNWHPAAIFMGDVGSVFLGYMLGGFLILLARDGYAAAALILPAYYLVDATVTLVRRGLRGEPVWRAHRQHFYQRAVQAGRSHSSVSLAILLTGLLLIGLAVLSVFWPIAMLALSILAGAGLCVWLARTGENHGG